MSGAEAGRPSPPSRANPAGRALPARKRAPQAQPPAMRVRIRRATEEDLPALQALERLCFQPWRQASRTSLRRSLRSARQSVWVVDQPSSADAGKVRRGGSPGLLAALVLWHHKTLLRVYGIATHPQARGQGVGQALMAHAEDLARRAGCAWVSLEADPQEPGLVGWYERQGYGVVARLPDFYGPRRHAVRLRKAV